MTIRDLVDLFVDDSMLDIAIYDLSKDKIIWQGKGDDLPYEFDDVEIESVDNLEKGSDVLTINISIDDEEN